MVTTRDKRKSHLMLTCSVNSHLIVFYDDIWFGSKLHGSLGSKVKSQSQ